MKGREYYRDYWREWNRRKKGCATSDRWHYTDEELMLIAAWTDQEIPDAEQARRLGRTSARAIQCARSRYKLRGTVNE
jgi:hypothetical protein